MDEPLSNLDAQLRLQMRIEIKRLQRELKATMLYVTHDQVEAMTMADRIAVMHKGMLQQLATPAELYARPVNLFVATFCGSPPMNILAGEIGEDGGASATPSGSLPLPAASHAGPVKLGFRPEHASTGRGDGQRIASRRDLCRRAARQRDTRHDQAGGCARQHPPAGGFFDADRQPLRGPARGATPASVRRRDRRSSQDSVPTTIRPAPKRLIRPT